MVRLCYAVSEDCCNGRDSFGEICVGCNCCGKINKDTMHQSRIKTYKEHLREEINRLRDGYYLLVIQRKNCVKEIVNLVNKIREAEIALKSKGA